MIDVIALLLLAVNLLAVAWLLIHPKTAIPFFISIIKGLEDE